MNIEAPAQSQSYEEEYLGFEIFVEPNPDKWNEGYIWSICKDGEEIDTGLEFDFNEALAATRHSIRELIMN